MMSVSCYGVVVLMWLLLPVFADKQVSKITRHHPLVVSYGRTLWLDPELHLKIEVPTKCRCEVSVVRDDPLAERTGYLTPHKFPCDFVNGEVRYVHLGSKAPSKDFVKLSVRVDSATETILRRVVLDISVNFLPMEIVKKNNDLVISRPGQTSAGINDQILQFAYDTERMEACRVIILDRLDSEKGLPRYGRLLNITKSADSFARPFFCRDFLTADIRYEHAKGVTSPKTDYIPMAVEIHRQTGQYVKEYFQVAVRIHGANTNNRPVASFAALEVMSVDQYVTKLITTDVLDAEDAETNPDYLIFNITQPLGSGEGCIVRTDDPHTPITSFYRKDIKDLKIAYKPPSEMANLKGTLEVVFEVIDTEAFHSEPIRLLIKVWPRNTLSPFVAKNKELVLFEGQSRIISSTDNLQILDKDNINDVKIYVVGGLRYGELYVNKKVARWFTPRDLDNGTIIYQHDNSDTYSDNIILNATDGKQYVEFAFVINIIPVDDEMPVVVCNTGLELEKGKSAIIDEYSLRASDIDSDTNKIEFLVGAQIQRESYLEDRMARPGLQAGFLMLRQKEQPDDDQMWIESDSYWIKTNIDSFTQEDILLRRLYYVHTGVEVFEDRFYFQLVDNAGKPNQSGLKLFNILIKQVDIRFPQVGSSCSMSAEVNNSRLMKLTRKMLWFTDADSDDLKLIYTIKQTPYFVSGSNQTKDAGSIVSTDNADIILSSFTQEQLWHHKVSYKPPSGHNRYIDMVVQFQFSVSDPVGHRVENQIFSLLLHAGRAQMNPARVIKLLVNEDGKLHFSSRYQLRWHQFVIVALPSHGTLYKNGQKLNVGGSFMVDDITSQRLLYVQKSGGGKLDEIRIRRTSGGEIATFRIQAALKPTDYNADIRTKNQSPSLVKVSAVNVEEAGSAIITSHKLQATDPDSDDQKLFFMVNAFPRRGELLVNGSVVNNFTQSDVISNLVVYRHDAEEIGVKEVHDFFNLTLSDDPQRYMMDESHKIVFTFHVRISPVDNKKPVIKVNDRLEVWEGGKTTVTTSNLMVTDADTIPDDITCHVDASPMEGFLENIAPSKGMEQSQVGIPIMSFTVRDLLSQRINYVQNNHIHNEPKTDLLALSCSDGLRNSQRHMMMIIIHGRNDEIPELFLTNFQVEEGESMTIDSVLLGVNDRDVPKDNLTIKLLVPPKHGVVVDRSKSSFQSITKFPFNKIKQNVITYNHDGTETAEDVLQFAVTDGVHEVRKDVIVNILPMDDETPRLVTNTGLSLTNIGETRMISSSALRAEDVDSPNENLTYVVRSIPPLGQLMLYEHTGRAYNLSRGSKFTQKDIDQGMVFYTDVSVVPVARQEIRFDVTDGRNSLVNQVFYIYMKPEDKVHPIVLSKGVQLKKGSSVTFSTDIITSTDPDSPDAKLEYYITKPPLKGIITMAEQPSIPISKFSQLHLAGHKVKYVHTSEDGSKVDSFQFEVSDGRHQVMRKFHIALLDGDNTRTVLKFGKLTVVEGETKEITSFELKAEDPDNTPDTLVFSVTQIPVNGFIMKLGRPTMVFTQEDIDNNLVSYQHDGTDTTRDSFSFTVSDGTHLDYYVFPDSKTLTRSSQTIEIDIQAIDNKTPQVIVNRGGTTLETIPGGALGLCLSNNLLKASDPDSNNTEIIYLISDPLYYGILINIGKGNGSLSEFKQSDIDAGLICFMLNKNEMNATSDRFYFDLTDPGRNELLNQRFSLHWARISLDRIVYKVSEIHRSVVITLTRNGFLGESSFIGIRTVDGSAKIREDFVPNSAEQVQFNPGERYKTWVILLIDDELYEGPQQFTVQIHSPVMAIMSGRQEAKIIITDPEDRSIISVSKLNYYVEESSGLANIGLYRHGDISKTDQVWCVTRSGTASGTHGSGIQSYSDFVSRSKTRANVVVFQQGERLKNCSVQLIDDSLYEEDEDFSVYILPNLDTVVSSKYNRSLVAIKPDINDEPQVYFDKTKYIVDEDADICHVTVKRVGSDLTRPASVVIRSKKTNPVSAKANVDYIPVSKTLYFSPGVQTQTVNIVILDDLGQPVREGPEYFELALALPINARVSVRERTFVVINDTHSDLPRIEFQESSDTIDEEDGMLSVIIVRSGDLSQRSAVRCYTRQITAKAGVDYYERSNSDDDVVIFEPNDRTQDCSVAIVDDSFYEGDEKFRLVLEQPQFQPGVGRSIIGKRSETTIKIVDNNDRPGIGFEQKRRFVNEPPHDDEERYVKLVVVRNGDTSRTSQVRLYTKDGSAKADTDFEPLSKVLIFGKNVTRLEVRIKILHDDEREMREAFTVHLTKDRNRVALIESNKVIVYIEENLYRTGVTFPLIPGVVSLKDYDDISKAKAEPLQGYPLICVTACDPKHPRYPETGSFCSRQSIDNTKTWYSWEVAAATGTDGVTNDFRSIDSQTFFASTSMITLDSIYFGPGSRVRCTARAITYENYKGLASTSEPVTISRKEGLCLPQQVGDIGSESFSAQITYTGLESATHPNMIRIRVLVPHIDGMLPALSTKSLSNFEITLTADASRRGQHLCSNLLDTHEVRTKSGFLTEHMTRMSGGTEPYQYSSALRGKSTLRFYRNLNLEACMWTFENYYTMSELVQECGGRIATDGQVHDLTRSHLSVRVPLYVSYIYHSPSALGGWMHFDHSSFLKMSFTYDTAKLWNDGIGTPEGSELKGYLYPTGVVIRTEDKRLVVTFRTVARFRGTFILAHKDQNIFSMVLSPDQPNLSFQLKLLRSAPTYNSPEQMWQFVSEFSVRDYSGTYYVKLIPCTVTQNVKYSVPLKCNPRMPTTFTLPIRFQQTSDPDAIEFNIRTQFFLLARQDVWLSNETNKVMEQSDAAFSLGSIIYGRIMVDPQQSLGNAYHVSVEKIFVCSGLDGYTPQYNPDSDEYGCLADSKLLSYRFKILDRGAPHMITQKFRNVPFAAKLAIDDESAHALVEQSNSDGFKFDSSPLFQVASGRQWYLHAIYTIRSFRSSTRGIGKRSTIIGESSHIVHSLSKRSAAKDPKKSPQGAALLRSIKLVYNDNIGDNNGQEWIRKDETNDDESSSLSLKWVLIVVITVCFILLVAVIVLMMLYRRKSRPVTTKVVEPGEEMQGTEV